MADSKISALTEATTLADADEFVIASSGASKRVKFSTLQSEVAQALAAGKVTRTAGNFATASTSFVDMTGMSVTITTGARRCLVTFSATVFHSAGGGASTSTDLNVDGTRIGGAEGLIEQYVTNAGYRFNVSFSWVSDVLSAASHTFKIQVKVSGGTGTWQADTNVPAILSVVELLNET